MTGHGQPENGTNVQARPRSPSAPCARELLPALRTGGDRAAGALGHASYNEIDGGPCTQPLAADQGPARGWGYKGSVQSDYFRNQGADRPPQADRRPGRDGGDGAGTPASMSSFPTARPTP
ncbi:hypothetical protein ACRAWD_28210 [Caulobacter segnis]